MKSNLRMRGMVVGMMFFGALIGLGLTQRAYGAAPDWTNFTGSVLIAPETNRVKVFPATDKRANFTHFTGMENVATASNALTFTMTGTNAVLGWGNYLGKQPLAEIVDMWDIRNDVVLRVRQLATSSVWTAKFWVDGKCIKSAAKEQSLEGMDWREFAMPKPDNALVPTPDGLEFEIRGTPGTRFEVEWLKLTQPWSECYFRKEFELPAGKIWSAVADVSGQTKMQIDNRLFVNRLSVNGHEVARRGALRPEIPAPVDLAPYLRSGTNCLGLHVAAVAYPPPFRASSYLQLTVVMESGEVIRVATDESWKMSESVSNGWDQAGYDNMGWAPAKTDKLSFGYYPYVSLYFIPTYAGRLVLWNPSARSLYYTTDSNVYMEVHIPAGLRARGPAIRYGFARVDTEGASVDREEGITEHPEERAGALVFPIALGRRTAGVYTIELTLLLDGAPVETREREPLIVLDTMPPTVIAGSSVMEGLNMELEATIDFTDPNDPHPWVESAFLGRSRPCERVKKAKIVATNGLTYREVATKSAASFFSYRLGKLKHPGDFYLFEAEYPDNAKRDFHVCIVSKLEGIADNVQAGTGVGTGGKAMLTGRMQKYQWVMVADSGVYSVDVLNHYGVGQTEGLPAAARSVKVYHVKGRLPSVGAGNRRRFGVDNESCCHLSAHGLNFGMDTTMSWPAIQKEKIKITNNPYLYRQRQLKDLVCMERTARAYCDYLAYAGQNTHVIGCYRYNKMTTAYVPAEEYPTSRVQPDLINVLAHYLDARGISFLARIMFCGFEQLNTVGNNAQVARGRDTVYMIDGDGRQRYWNISSTGIVPPNMLHPAIREQFRRFIGDFGRTFAHLKRFKGIYFWLDAKAYSPPAFVRGETNFWNADYNGGYLDYTYDNYSFAAFQEWAGIKPVNDAKDTDRFQKRRAMVRDNNLLAKYLSWRCRSYVQGLAELGLDALREVRPDLVFMCPLNTDPVFYKAWTQSGLSFRDYARRLGFEPESFNAKEGLSMGVTSTAWSPYFFYDGKTLYHRSPYAWIPRVNDEVAGAFSTGQVRFMQMFANQEESFATTYGFLCKGWGHEFKVVEGDWVMDAYKLRSNAQMGGVHAREPFIQALIASDVNQLYFGWSDVNLPIGHEHELRAFARVFTHLPTERFVTDLDTGFESNLVIRHLTKEGATFCYVANPGFWPIRGRIRVETDGAITDLVDGMPIEAKREGRNAVMPVALDGYGLTAFQVSSTNWRTVGFETDQIGSAEFGYISGIVKEVRVSLADPAIVLALSKDDKAYLDATLKDAEAALASREYARAWHRVTHWRFCVLREEVLDSIKKRAALLQSIRESGIDAAAIQDCYRVNCGSSAPYTDKAGNKWLPDVAFIPGLTAWGYDPAAGGDVVDRGKISFEGTLDPCLHQTERFGSPHYIFKVKPGRFTVRLHFSESSLFQPGEYKQDVVIAGVTVLKDWDMNLEAGVFCKAIVKTFSDVIVNTNELKIEFPNGKIMAIEVIRQTDNK